MPIKSVVRAHTTVVENIAAVSCNVCGKEADMAASRPGWPDGFHDWNLEGGYGDNFPGDMERMQIVACEDCLKAWVKTFKHPEVFLDAPMSHQPVPVTHTETNQNLFLVQGFLVVDDPEAEIPKEAWDLEIPDEDQPRNNSLWEHFKGKKYLVLGVAFLWPSKEPVVHYRPLYGDSPNLIRPLSMWFTEVEPNTPRFRFLT